MATARRADISEALRQHVLSALHFRTLGPGRRLPSARRLAGELRADPRVVLAAYRSLEREGLVERRPPSRAFYVAADRPEGDVAAPPTAAWLADVLAEGLARGVRVPDFAEHARRATETVRLRAVCVAGTRDELVGVGQELSEDYGIVADRVELDALLAAEAPATLLRRADLVVVGAHDEAAVRPVVERTGMPLVPVRPRADLVNEIARLLARGPLWFVGTDPRLEAVLRARFAGGADEPNLRVAVVGRDDLAAIPAGAPAYVLRAAREALGGVPPHLRPLSTLRAFSAETRRKILRFVVRANQAATASRPAPDAHL